MLGLVLALVAAVFLLSLGVSHLQILLPIVRFPSLIWTVGAPDRRRVSLLSRPPPR